MTVFEYTREYTLHSSWLDLLFYNENNNTAAIVVDDGSVYVYTGVDNESVAELVSADSPGGHYNYVWKKKYGPSHTHDEDYWDYEFVTVPVEKETPGTPKGLVDATTAETREFSLNAPVSEDVKEDAGLPETREYSLAEIGVTDTGVEADSDYVTSTVVYTLDSVGDNEFKYNSNATDLEYAIEELSDLVSRLGQKGKVKEVCFKFNE